MDHNRKSVPTRERKQRKNGGATFGDFIIAAALETKLTIESRKRNEMELSIDDNQPSDLTSEDTVDTAVIEFLKKVKHFQDRAWKENPIKAKAKRRLVFGLREVRKQLTLEAARCVILARDIETGKSDELANEMDTIKQLCESKHIDTLWISSKRNLGKAMKKWPFVSAIAVLDYRGAEDAYSTAMQKYMDFTHSYQIAGHIDQTSLFA